MKTWNLTELTRSLGKYKYVLLVLALGLLLLLLPRSSGGGSASQTDRSAARGDPMAASGIPLEAECERLAAFLSGIRGVGEARVLLSSSGAAVACAGADSPEVRLAVTEAVAVYTGLGSDRIRVLRLQNSNNLSNMREAG